MFELDLSVPLLNQQKTNLPDQNQPRACNVGLFVTRNFPARLCACVKGRGWTPCIPAGFCKWGKKKTSMLLKL